mgnify:CR=1 FL=1
MERDPAAALLELEQHLAQFPRGELADERELLRVQALCRLDRRTDSKRVGRDDRCTHRRRPGRTH